MIDICYTVLHYGKEDITIKCIESLIRISKDFSYKIIVLDNGSKNDSLNKIQLKFDYLESLICLSSHENLGFSRGNNLLYREAKKFDPRYIAVLNNDIEITQKEFIETLFVVDNDSDAYVIGPDIHCPSLKKHQSPLYRSIPYLEQIEEEMQCNYEIVNQSNNRQVTHKNNKIRDFTRKIIPQCVVELYRLLKQIIKGVNLNLNYRKEIINPVLSGACIIVTKQFIQNEDVLFEPDTNFFFEELLLAQRCKKKNYKTIYTPKLKVLHHHSFASRNSSKSNEDYIIKTAQRMISAFEVYKKTIYNR